MMETIEFQKKKYPLREIKLPKIGEVLISTTSLNDALLKNGNYVSKNAAIIYELIYFFVSEREINLSNKNLIYLVEKELL